MHLLLIKDEINRERMFDDFAPTCICVFTIIFVTL
jgi:hypothetical protein